MQGGQSKIPLFEFATNREHAVALRPGGELLLAAYLARAIGQGVTRLPGHAPGYADGALSLIATRIDGLLRAELLLPPTGGRDRRTGEPLVTLLVASGVQSGQGATSWPDIVRDYGGPAGLPLRAGVWATWIEHTGAATVNTAMAGWLYRTMGSLAWGWLTWELYRAGRYAPPAGMLPTPLARLNRPASTAA